MPSTGGLSDTQHRFAKRDTTKGGSKHYATSCAAYYRPGRRADHAHRPGEHSDNNARLNDANTRIAELRVHMDARFDDMRDSWRATVSRVTVEPLLAHSGDARQAIDATGHFAEPRGNLTEKLLVLRELRDLAGPAT
jgi:hypothetical protein